MLKALGLKLLFSAIGLIFTKELYKEVKEAVLAKMDLQVSGEDKKMLVKKEVADVVVTLKNNFGNFAGAALNLLIEVAYTEISNLQGRLSQ